jgi:peptidoglycan hydrolase-like protein with peptidoglycan-binding domain
MKITKFGHRCLLIFMENTIRSSVWSISLFLISSIILITGVPLSFAQENVSKPFTLTLQRGSTGEDVRQLQEFLSQFSDIYPEQDVTGFFGMATKEAIQRFQSKHGLDAQGIVGPRTRQVLNNMMSGSKTSMVIPPMPATSVSNSPFEIAIKRISGFEERLDAQWKAFGMMNRIDNLSGATLRNVTVSGASGLTDADIPDDITVTGSPSFTSITTTASSTLANGINLTGGCFSVSGICITSSTGTINSGTLNQLAYFASNGTTLSGLATSSLGIFLSDTLGTLGVSRGGSGSTSFGQGWLYSDGGANVLAASTSPTVNYITATSTTATSTFANGINITGGCLSISGTCLAGGSGVSLSAANAWTALQSFTSGASTTQQSVFSKAYFGGTATSTFDSIGVLTLASPLGVSSGGIGWNTITAGSILFGNGSSAIATSSNLSWDTSTNRLTALNMNITGTATTSTLSTTNVVTTGSAPTISTCGTSPSVVGNNMAGTVTIGSGIVTACTVTFASSFSATPTCVVTTSSGSISVGVTSLSSSAFTAGFSATLGSGKLYYICIEMQ